MRQGSRGLSLRAGRWPGAWERLSGAGSPGRPEQRPQQAGPGAQPQGPGTGCQAPGRAVTLAALAAGDGEGAAVRGHGAVGAHGGAGLHDQDATGVRCGERGEGPWVAAPSVPTQPALGEAGPWPGPFQGSWGTNMSAPKSLLRFGAPSVGPVGLEIPVSPSRQAPVGLSDPHTPHRCLGSFLCLTFGVWRGGPAPPAPTWSRTERPWGMVCGGGRDGVVGDRKCLRKPLGEAPGAGHLHPWDLLAGLPHPGGSCAQGSRSAGQWRPGPISLARFPHLGDGGQENSEASEIVWGSAKFPRGTGACGLRAPGGR